jgi:hypothetical protein
VFVRVALLVAVGSFVFVFLFSHHGLELVVVHSHTAPPPPARPTHPTPPPPTSLLLISCLGLPTSQMELGPNIFPSFSVVWFFEIVRFNFTFLRVCLRLVFAHQHTALNSEPIPSPPKRNIINIVLPPNI